MLFLVTMVQVKKIYLKPLFFLSGRSTSNTTNRNVNGYILIIRLAFCVQAVKIKSKSLIR